MDTATKKSGETNTGERWRETPGGVFRVYTVGRTYLHAELCVQRKGPNGGVSWEPHYRNPCEGDFIKVYGEAKRREAKNLG